MLFNPHGSYSQQGEDMVALNLLRILFAQQFPISYLDIGSNHPIVDSNSFMFYLNGGKGVLVEPNPIYRDAIKLIRPRDRHYAAGVSFNGSTEATYYDFGPSFSGVNTFSESVAKAVPSSRPGATLIQKVKMPMVDINKIIAENFPSGAPDFLSIDVEGHESDILRMIDLSKVRPKVICCEIFSPNYRECRLYLQECGYMRAASTLINDLFVDIARATDKGAINICIEYARSNQFSASSRSIVYRGASLLKLMAGTIILCPGNIALPQPHPPVLFIPADWQRISITPEFPLPSPCTVTMKMYASPSLDACLSINGIQTSFKIDASRYKFKFKVTTPQHIMGVELTARQNGAPGEKQELYIAEIGFDI